MFSLIFSSSCSVTALLDTWSVGVCVRACVCVWCHSDGYFNCSCITPCLVSELSWQKSTLVCSVVKGCVIAIAEHPVTLTLMFLQSAIELVKRLLRAPLFAC